MRQDWARITINLDGKVAEQARLRAKTRKQSMSAYIATLIEADLGISAVHTIISVNPLQGEIQLRAAKEMASTVTPTPGALAKTATPETVAEAQRKVADAIAAKRPKTSARKPR